MEIVDAATFTADRAWGSRGLIGMGAYAARLHWTDEHYRWHANTGEELFVVLDGIVDLHYDDGDGPRQVELRPGQIAVIREGEPHVAHPRGAARILVIERHDAGDTVP